MTRFHSLTCRTPCPGWGCDCPGCHTCDCGHPITEPGLWLVPTVPPGPWTDRCSQDCARRAYDKAVEANGDIDMAVDREIRQQRAEDRARDENGCCATRVETEIGRLR